VRALLAELPSALVAYSGGVDSTLLLRVAHEALGERCFALTTVSPTTPAEDIDDAKRLAAAIGARHVLVDANELDIPGYAENPINRCYFCKDNLFAICTAEATRRDLAAVLDGANVDDLGDHRPGLQAAAEQGVRHLLVEAGLRGGPSAPPAARSGLPTWDRPASPCLSSRFPYGTRITVEASPKWDPQSASSARSASASCACATASRWRASVPVGEMPGCSRRASCEGGHGARRHRFATSR
jgi:uncharacterized protein